MTIVTTQNTHLQQAGYSKEKHSQNITKLLKEVHSKV